MGGLRGLWPSESQDVTVSRFQMLDEGKKTMRAKSGNVGETMSHTNCVMLLPEKMSVMGECLGYFKCSQKAFSRLGLFWYYEMWRYFSLAAAPATTFFFFSIGQPQPIQSSPLFSHKHLKRPTNNSFAFSVQLRSRNQRCRFITVTNVL